jgi:beta-lactamase superfamily II metal-dependent hydrolase
MDELLEMIDSYTGVVSNDQLEPPGIQIQTLHNDYPLFKGTNNLSLLTFLDIGGLSFILPGDLEQPGWIELLKNPYVCTLLGRVNIFVASHHGRESGYCREVFDYCSPSLVVMSDEPIQYDTQKMAGIYGQHATGG